jgi:excisionase family DNA binding protein
MEDRVRRVQIESLMTPRQVAQFLQVSVCTVGRWSRQGRLKFFRVGRRGDMRYRLEDVLRFIEDSTAQPREPRVTVGTRSL